ncbi:EcsC family protein [Salibacterium salarium]|uniref:EcsC family protein n=2 Tax=Salibacterium salarium TaxID=284579 RepID=A0A3R9RH69_9BACI|nr:EcsC family protein [Salibacterium salarium]
MAKNIQKLMEWSYDKSLNGLPQMDSAEELANNYLSKHKNSEDAIKALIKTQNMKAATSGFLTGLGGVIALPVAIPASVGSLLYVQTRMVAAIAHIRGYNLKDDQVKTLVFVSLTGNAAADVLRNVGIDISKKITMSYIKRKLSGEVLKKINRLVGFRLLTKTGSTGVINLTKAVPLLGGIVGGTFDASSTYVVGKVAKKQLFNQSPTFTV